jgi:hypothetical protein
MHNEELHNLYNSPNIIRVIISSRVRWTGHEMALRETVGSCGLHLYQSGKGPVAGSCENSNDSSGSINGGEFLD